MGSFGTEKATKQNTESATVNPWSGQAPYLEDIFKKAQGAYNSTNNTPYQGDVVAGATPDQQSLYNNMVSFSNLSPVSGLLQDQGASLGAVGSEANRTGIEGLTNFNPTGSAAGTIADAGLYADNPYMSSMVDSAMRDAGRQTYESIIPGIGRAAAGSGNTNSSRTGAATAIAERALADRSADTSAALRGSAYQQGLGLAQDQYKFNDNARLNQYGTLGNMGVNTAGLGASNLTGSVSSAADLFNIGNAGGLGQQANNQAQLDNDKARFDAQQQAMWGPLAQYMQIVGANQWGSDSTGKSNTNATQTASPASQIAGILGAAGSAAKAFI